MFKKIKPYIPYTIGGVLLILIIAAVWSKVNGEWYTSVASGMSRIYYNNSTTNWATPYIHYGPSGSTSWSDILMSSSSDQNRLASSGWVVADIPTGSQFVFVNGTGSNATSYAKCNGSNCPTSNTNIAAGIYQVSNGTLSSVTDEKLSSTSTCGQNEVCNCVCASGYTGTAGNCTLINPCQGITCYNGGSCTGGTCNCVTGWTGANCQSGSGCYGVNCNNGNCSNGVCNCATGWSGAYCNNNIMCNSMTCYNGGSCSNGICSCTGGYTGPNCQTLSGGVVINPAVVVTGGGTGFTRIYYQNASLPISSPPYIHFSITNSDGTTGIWTPVPGNKMSPSLDGTLTSALGWWVYTVQNSSYGIQFIFNTNGTNGWVKCSGGANCITKNGVYQYNSNGTLSVVTNESVTCGVY